jgi:glycosyltransferase involved in cell wall biosynthesis
VLEALAAGVPVVTTDRGAIGETVTDGENGFVLDDPNPDVLAACVLTLLDDPKLRARFSRAARDAYLERFTQAQADRVLCDWLAAVE